MKEELAKTLNDIYLEKKAKDIEIKNRIRELHIKINNVLYDYFITKGFIKDENFCYDPKTNLAIRFYMPYIDITNERQSFMINIYYKIGDEYLNYYLKSLSYKFKVEEPEKVFNRFKKYNNKTEITKIKDFFIKNYQSKMVALLREEKLTELIG